MGHRESDRRENKTSIMPDTVDGRSMMGKKSKLKTDSAKNAIVAVSFPMIMAKAANVVTDSTTGFKLIRKMIIPRVKAIFFSQVSSRSRIVSTCQSVEVELEVHCG